MDIYYKLFNNIIFNNSELDIIIYRYYIYFVVLFLSYLIISDKVENQIAGSFYLFITIKKKILN